MSRCSSAWMEPRSSSSSAASILVTLMSILSTCCESVRAARLKLHPPVPPPGCALLTNVFLCKHIFIYLSFPFPRRELSSLTLSYERLLHDFYDEVSPAMEKR